MDTGDTLLVGQLSDGSWPPPDKWMQGYNEVTYNRGEFPGGAYVEFVEEFAESEPSPEEEEPPPLPPLPPQPSPRHNVPPQGFALPGLGGGGKLPSRSFHGNHDPQNASPARVSGDGGEDEDPPPPAPPPRNASRGSIGGPPAAPPKPAPRRKSDQKNTVATPTRVLPTVEDVDQHRWSRVTFSIPVQCAGCE